MDSQPVVRKMMYGGEWRDALSGETFESRNPANGSLLASLPRGVEADTKAAIDYAADAYPAWSKETAAARAKHLHRVAGKLEEKREDIARLITQEEGKPLQEARNEMNLTIDLLTWYAEEGRRANGAWIPDPVSNRRMMTMKEPIGVCGAVIPWNVPASMITRKAAPALAAGCTMVMKPAEVTSAVGSLVAEAFLEADLPPGVFNLITGKASAIGSTFLEDERVRKISFTGSTEVGRRLLRGAADHVKRVSMELGGNAPVILFEDCDPEKAITALCSLKFRNAGQACISANRIYVHRSLYDTVAERLGEYAGGLNVGDGLENGINMGPLVEPEAVQKVKELVDDAVEKGATPVSGGATLLNGKHANGSFFQPTVLAGMTPQMRIAKEEIFGPVAPLFVFDTEEEVVAAANDVPYGLAAYIFTENLGRAIRVAEGLESGMVGVNDIRISASEGPFGGVKQSGIGREGGKEGLEEYLETKLVALGI